MSEVRAVAFETDVLGERSNNEFLASFLDVESGNDGEWLVELELAYTERKDDLEAVVWVIEEIEKELEKLGFTVIWDNGVFIFRTEDLEELWFS